MFRLLLCVCFLFIGISFTNAQTCSGNLGDNIFTEGDFGSGSANILLPDPGIAPGFAYDSNDPPPFDGQYVVTNNTGAWSALYGTWLAIGDNSPDPDGYMMVVNASFEPGLFYDQVIDDLCENTTYEFSADIINLIQVGVAGHLDPNVSFLLDDVVQFTTGNIPKTEMWQTYGFTFNTSPGQTSIRLSLRNNAPGGIGNDLGLDNISFRTCGDEALILPETPADICEDGNPITLFATVQGNLYDDPAYQWQISPDGVNNWMDIPGANNPTYDHSFLAAGTYYYRFQLANGAANLGNLKCRINSNVKLVRVQPKEYFVTDTICIGLNIAVGNSLYNQTGNYMDSLISSIGCDSIIFTDLTVLPDPGMVAEVELTPPSCFNTIDGALAVLAVQNGSFPYTYDWSNGMNTGTVLTGLPGATDHRLLVTDRYGCTLDTLVFLPAPSPLNLDLGPDQNLILGETANINALLNFTPDQYFWSSTSDGLPCGTETDCTAIEWIPTQSQQVLLTVEDEFGCTVTDSVYLFVQGDYRLYIPNVFTPNNDGVNDDLIIFGPSERLQEISDFKIFDRWGQLLTQQNTLQPGQPAWDGISKGQPAAQGVYVYHFTAIFIDGTVLHFSGDVMVLN